MNPASRSRRAGWLPWLLLLLTLGTVLRLVNLTSPPLDFHPTRQLRNALVARAIYYEADPSAEAGKRSLSGTFRRAVGQYEPPIFEGLVGGTYLLTGSESFAVPRIYATIFWLLAGLALFDLSRRLSSPGAALIALCYFLVLPFAVQASRSFQPDPLMAAAFVIGIYFLHRWGEEQRWRWAILAALFAGLAVLVKIVIVFMVAGGTIALVLTTLGRRFWRSPQVWAMAAIMTLPAAAYYLIVNPSRSSEYFFAWSVDLARLIASPHFYADWLGFVGSLTGLTILFASLAGVFLASAGLRWLLAGLWLGYLLYGLTLPFQMFTHSYYHLQLVPVIALGLLPIIDAVLQAARRLDPAWRTAMLAPLVVFAAYEAWAARSVLVAEDFSRVPSQWETIGAAIPGNADVIALTQDYGFDLMYWGWRKVQLWPLNTDLSEFRNSGRDLARRFEQLTTGKEYFLVTALGQLDDQPALAEALQEYAVAASGDGYILYDLRAHR